MVALSTQFSVHPPCFLLLHDSLTCAHKTTCATNSRVSLLRSVEQEVPDKVNEQDMKRRLPICNAARNILDRISHLPRIHRAPRQAVARNGTARDCIHRATRKARIHDSRQNRGRNENSCRFFS